MKKVIVITGSSTGFGALMVKTFDNAGHTVIATMRNVKDKNAEFAAKLNALPNTEVMDLDVTSDESVKTAVAGIYEKYGKIDVLINNAGIYGGGVLEAFSIPQIQKLYEVNVWGVLRVNNEVLPAMRAVKDGLIITISSAVGRISPPFQVAYNSTKFALEGFIEGSYAELIGHGVETVLIEPGAFLTEIMGKPGTNADREGVQESYGEETAAMSQFIQQGFMKIFAEAAPDPQLVADAAFTLVNTEKGKRPLRTPVDPSAHGLDIEYNNTTNDLKTRWMSEYGF
ncbi:SDR family oxidoreductase [Pedobacter sp. L105]|uniref:SDR family oxidoreductase n=1 Tax=Pedobacter sp. L105 TaxID=1641871 RepID=UPI00131DBEBE|nr:SDR family oxidoreductase [Pedobacter sp. L105]